MFSINKGIIESNKVILKRYIISINITLIIELLVNLIYNLLIIFKVEYSELISLFKISFIVVIYILLSISNKNTNII